MIESYGNFLSDTHKFCSGSISRETYDEAIAYAYQLHRKILAEKETEFQRRLAEQETEFRRQLAEQEEEFQRRLAEREKQIREELAKK